VNDQVHAVSATRGASSDMRAASDENQFLLATLPPSKVQIRLAVGIVLALIATFLVIAPFANIRLPQLGSFYLVILTVTMLNDLITSALLFSQFFVVRRTALFALAISYLFTGSLTIPFMLVFPGGFSPTGLIGAGLQSAALITVSYRLGISLGLIAYALLRNADSTTSFSGRSLLVIVIGSVALVVAIVCGLTWVATAKEALLPIIFADTVVRNRGPAMSLAVVQLTLIVLALALLRVRWRSVLDVWLMVACFTELLFQIMSGFIVNERFTLGWYGARGYGLIATMAVLLALLSETTALYAKLARSVIRERNAREAREVAMDGMAAAMAHELKQPLTSIALDGGAALRFIEKSDRDEARAAIESVVRSAHRAAEVIDSIRSLYKRDLDRRTWLNVNEVVRQAVTTLDTDLRTHRILVATELRDALPQLFGSRALLEEVFVNLITNAIEAMHAVTDHERRLRISSDLRRGSTVVVTVEDTGTGIDEKDRDRIFEYFFTTKSKGMGIGLAICRAIVESHGGSLHASANSPYGTIFHVALPSGKSS